jgi:hypothetical protein
MHNLRLEAYLREKEMNLLGEQSQRAAGRAEITHIASYKSVQRARSGVVWIALKLLSLLFVIVLLFVVSAYG